MEKAPLKGVSEREQAVMRMNTEQVPKSCDANADPASTRGRLPSRRKRANRSMREFAGALVTACLRKESCGSQSTTSRYPRFNSPWISRTAPCALRPGRYPYCSSARSASKIGSNTMTAAICTTRSLIVGTDHSNCTCAPCRFGIGAYHPSISPTFRAAFPHPQDQEDRRTGSLKSLRREKRQPVHSPRLDRSSRASPVLGID